MVVVTAFIGGMVVNVVDVVDVVGVVEVVVDGVVEGVVASTVVATSVVVTGSSANATTRVGDGEFAWCVAAFTTVADIGAVRVGAGWVVVVATTLDAATTCVGGATTRWATTIDTASASVTVPVVIHEVKARSCSIDPPRVRLVPVSANVHSVI